ncbi:MAG: hydroxyacid dehydrogenase [Oscillospiraceae bacterium]|jgi:phosphoglycerate dehydrogenase-like enzyme|nr:hydroxyacid dehydrogenase [Oscillospiraceae bacterium]
MNLLLTGAFNYSDEQKYALEALGYKIKFLQDERSNSSGWDFLQFQAVVCNGLFLYNDINRFKNLQFLQTTSAGLDRIPLDYIEQNGIKLCNARGVYSVPMAEWAVLKTLELYKKSAAFYTSQKKHEWQKQRDLEELCGKTVCIAGLGSVGTECAKRFKAFGCKIVGVDISDFNAKAADSFFFVEDIAKAIDISDVVVLTLPLTDQTRGMINADLLKNFGGKILINIARGAIINGEDLTKALQKGILHGAALDVFEDEPLPADSPLWDMQNVLVTPHNSFVSGGNNARLFDLIYKNLKEFANV